MYADPDRAPVSEKVKAALRLIETMTLRPGELGPSDVARIRAAGVSDAAIVDAATVCALFNVVDRLADAFAFHVPGRETLDRHAGFLIKYGYALPLPLRVTMR